MTNGKGEECAHRILSKNYSYSMKSFLSGELYILKKSLALLTKLSFSEYTRTDEDSISDQFIKWQFIFNK